ncbi:MAG: hypothetical protein AB7J63_15860 [Vicinamibacterales bacterium]
MTHPAIAAALSTLPAENRMFGDLRQRMELAGDILHDLDFARAFAPYIVAIGALATDREGGVIDVANAIAYERFNLEARVGDAVKADEAEAREHAAYVLTEIGARAGYLLGFVVGQQLTGALGAK